MPTGNRAQKITGYAIFSYLSQSILVSCCVGKSKERRAFEVGEKRNQVVGKIIQGIFFLSPRLPTRPQGSQDNATKIIP